MPRQLLCSSWVTSNFGGSEGLAVQFNPAPGCCKKLSLSLLPVLPLSCQLCLCSKVFGNKAARYDTVHGRFKHDVKIGEKDELIVNGHKIKCIQASREGPKALPWKDSYFLIFYIFFIASRFSSPKLESHELCFLC